MGQTFRAPVYCENGIVATPHYLASLAGVQVLRDGGNAMDAAIAANAVVSVAWPHMCGVGGDLFMQVYWAKSGDVFGLNASGRSSRHASVDRVRELGHEQMPKHGGLSVSVPGAVDGWLTALERFGTRGLDQLLAPAVSYAENGFPISALLSQAIQNKLPIFQQHPAGLEIYAPKGQPPGPGDRLANPDLARTLRTIGREGRSGFYSGEVASLVSAAIREAGGLVDEEDLAVQRSEWVAPLRSSYRSLEVCEMPPNTQGVTALQMFNLMEGFDLCAAGHNSAQAIHWMVEAKRLAFADRDRFVADPSTMTVPAEQLASKSYAQELRTSIADDARSESSAAVTKAAGDTIYLCVVDRDGNAVSLIQSLFDNFGSGVVVAGAGVVLQNRAAAFSLDPSHPNHIAPRKRPLHTLIPALALTNGKPTLVFGTRGANGQPQTQAQVLANVVDFGMNAQEAVEAPRWVHDGPASHHPPNAVVVESRVPDVARVVDDLRGRGHDVVVSTELDLGMGTAQVIQVDQQRGMFIGGSDPRGDGIALGW